MFELAEVNQIVQLKTNNEWNNVYGIIDRITENVIYIASIFKPWYRYKIVKGWNERELIIYPDVNKLR